jgi:hypothetical protein
MRRYAHTTAYERTQMQRVQAGAKAFNRQTRLATRVHAHVSWHTHTQLTTRASTCE